MVVLDCLNTTAVIINLKFHSARLFIKTKRRQKPLLKTRVKNEKQRGKMWHIMWHEMYHSMWHENVALNMANHVAQNVAFLIHIVK